MNDLVKRLRGRRVSASLRNDRSGTLEMREIQDPLAVEAADCIEELKRELAAERERADKAREEGFRSGMRRAAEICQSHEPKSFTTTGVITRAACAEAILKGIGE